MSWKEVYRLLGRRFIDDTGINWKEAVMGSIDGRSRRPMYPRGSWMARNADHFGAGWVLLVLICLLGANQLFFRFFYTQPMDMCKCSRFLQLIVYFIFSWDPRRPFRYRLTPDYITYANSNDPSRSLHGLVCIFIRSPVFIHYILPPVLHHSCLRHSQL